MRFWDSSAIVPLIISQDSSPEVDQWLGDDAEIAIWTLTPIEVVSAIMRLAREGAIHSSQTNEAENRIDDLQRSCHVVIDIESVKEHARRLLRVHPLRAADAMQLGAAWEWASGRPGGRVFHSLDVRLALAARREGFRVVPETS